MSNPYQSLPPKNFWKTAVSGLDPFNWQGLYSGKLGLTPTTKIATAGSCFAQHMARQLKKRGFEHRDYEPAPPFLPDDQHADFGYGIYSARFGNVYTARQLCQLFDRAFGHFEPHETAWQSDGRFFDPFRPTVEPGGFSSLQELEVVREAHFESVREMFKQSEVLVFTLGLTEAWRSREDGAVYPVCPGVAAGTFDSEKHEFHNFSFSEVLADLTDLFQRSRELNDSLKFLLTVSPVPLTATAEDQHVVVATIRSKSVLRAVAGELSDNHSFVDYFPSYEIITAPASRGELFEADLRRVSPTGVQLVMHHFFAHHGTEDRPTGDADQPTDAAQESDLEQINEEVALLCDDELLNGQQR